MRTIVEVTLRMARDNPTWGYDRIVGALAHVGHRVAPNTVKKILKSNGIDPAPARRLKTSWRKFLKAQWSSIAAADFLTTEVWSASGLVTYYTLFVIDLATRTIEIVGSTPWPDEEFMKQVARNLTDCVDGYLRKHRFLIIDRDAKFSGAFRDLLLSAGVTSIRCPPRSPNCNAFAERFVRSIKSECLDRMIFFGAKSLRHALTEYAVHYNRERPHQGLGNVLISPEDPPSSVGCIERRARLGGLLNHYRRVAA